MNIAFYSMGNREWLGGLNHLKSLLYALKYAYEEKVKKYFISRPPESDNRDTFKSVTDAAIVIPYLKRGTPLWLLDNIAKRVFNRRLIDEIYLKKEKINAIFGQCIQYNYKPIRTLPYIYDFQHKYLPEMFSEEECSSRDRLFFRTAKASFRLIVASESIKNDIQTFLPNYLHKVRIIRPVINIPESIYTIDPASIAKLYKLPEKFIYLPSQFWKHKNHKIVFDAVKMLKNRGIPINIVCSGSTKDWRHPTYYADLLKDLSGWDYKGQIICLGIIAYEHLFSLMRQSICVINPSLFEGFGMTPSEAKSLGKQVLLSDIPPHHEHNHTKATFFNPHDVEDIAEKLTVIWQHTTPGPDPTLEEKARQELPVRTRECAHSFMSVAKSQVLS